MRMPNLAELALLGGLGLSACVAHAPATEGGVAEAQPLTVRSPDEVATAELSDHHRHHHHGGVPYFIAMSLDTLGTDDVKRAQVERIQGELRTCMGPAREIEQNLLMAFADGVAVGVVDGARVDATIAQLNTAAGPINDCAVDAVNQLHAMLSPTEREALVDKVQAHWAVWRQVNYEAEAGGREQGGRIAELARELSLTSEQVATMSSALRVALAELPGRFDAKRVEAHVQAFATAFIGESFDARSVTANANSHLATHGSMRMAIFYETVAPMLTGEQRAKLAEDLREHANHQPAVSAK
jgi:hypothetical protein